MMETKDRRSTWFSKEKMWIEELWCWFLENNAMLIKRYHGFTKNRPFQSSQNSPFLTQLLSFIHMKNVGSMIYMDFSNVLFTILMSSLLLRIKIWELDWNVSWICNWLINGNCRVYVMNRSLLTKKNLKAWHWALFLP